MQEEKTQTLSTEIFKNGILVSYSIGFWDGKKKQDDLDLQTQSANTSAEIYEKGNKLLLPPGALKEFYGFRARMGLTLSRYSFGVPGLRGCRFVPKSVYPQLREFLEKERDSFYNCAEKFLEKYDDYKKAQIEIFNRNYPANKGQLDDAYPDENTVRSRFSYFWMPYTWNYCEIDVVRAESKATLEAVAEGIVAQSCLTMRQGIQEEIVNVLRSLSNSKHKIGSRAVSGLLEKIEQLKQINVFGDKDLDAILEEAKCLIKAVPSWKKEDIQKTNFEVSLRNIFKSVGEEIKQIIEDPTSQIEFIRSVSFGQPVEEPEEVIQVTRRTIS